jgi:hypothetical protein
MYRLFLRGDMPLLARIFGSFAGALEFLPKRGVL